MRLLYTVLYALGFVLLSPLFLYKMWRRGKYRTNFFQRFGRYDPALRAVLAAKPGARAWIQAVSVGEVNLALFLIGDLRREWPALELVLTTTTSTGYALARDRLPAGVSLVYFPQDFPAVVRRAYDLIRPDLVVLIESEVWPNHIWAAARRGVPVVLINARMSPRSVRRYRWVRWLFRDVFGRLAAVCAQSEEDAAHYREAGAAAERVQCTGNMKYDASLSADRPATIDPPAILRQAGVMADLPVLLAASTHPGEEEILFDLLRRLRTRFPGLVLVLVPRHVERTRDVVELARRRQIRLVLRTAVAEAAASPASSPDCLLVNTTGELRWFYMVATVIFVGKSLVGVGGQNIVEAAASGRPVVFGPHMQNFRAIAREFVAAGAGA
ncbi:3-deoxy-D-manno-octulosonic acid transferase, partial [bacterium]|nr:3-deoxy-D-manno-octulosonic acid transferase [bacterium]